MDDMDNLAAAYPPDITQGSPFDAGNLNALTPNTSGSRPFKETPFSKLLAGFSYSSNPIFIILGPSYPTALRPHLS
ncbi:hypothetical protein DXG01_004655 [Tephrocybe rancida]|nr:hypothetical protein DXG01_004655 [Tephrocybe rancida]